jgi:hypothetical protein
MTSGNFKKFTSLSRGACVTIAQANKTAAFVFGISFFARGSLQKIDSFNSFLN